ncbi:MAG: hypothetical protein HY232_19160 [Acidobacteria bacterium]|nr:hypothetical protein [Acidobacteriota bacterium]
MQTPKPTTLRQRPKERGVALILVLLMSLILSLISAAMIFTVQTDTSISSNYRHANQALHVADAGVQRGLNWFINSYTPHIPISDYQTTTDPVLYPSANGQAVMIAGQTGSTSNYPNDATVNSFVAVLGNSKIIADSNNSGKFSINATLLKSTGVTAIFAGPTAIERWRLDSSGNWESGSGTLATSHISAIIENSAGPFFSNAIWGKDYANLAGNAATDSYDPTRGPYGGSNKGTNGSVGTNGSISLAGNGTIGGDALYLPPGGCSGCQSGGNVAGSVIAESQPRGFPSIPPFNVGNMDISGTQTINPGAYRNISVGNHETLTLNAGTYFMDGFSVSTNGTVLLNGAVSLFIKSSYSSAAGNYAVNAGGDPKNLQIYYNGTADMSFTGQANFSGVVYAPNAGIKIAGLGNYFGSFVGSNVDMSGNGAIHYADNLQNDLMTMLPFHLINWVHGN